MLYLTVCLCWTACALAAPATEVVSLEKQQPTVIPIVSQSEEFEPNGTYKFSYETGNGIKREESSYTKLVPRVEGRSADSNEGGETGSEEIHVQEGSYSYTAPDGTLISVRYIADENGFRPIGSHIPTIKGLASSVSSAEKSGRALKVADNAEAGSASASKSVPKLEPRSGVAPEDSKPTEAAKPTEESSEASKTNGTTEGTSGDSSTEKTKTSEMQPEASTTEVVGLTESTTLAATTEAEAASSGLSTTESEKVEVTSQAPSTELSATESEKVEISTQAPTTEGSINASSTESAKTDSTTEVAKTEASITTEIASTTA